MINEIIHHNTWFMIYIFHLKTETKNDSPHLPFHSFWVRLGWDPLAVCSVSYVPICHQGLTGKLSLQEIIHGISLYIFDYLREGYEVIYALTFSLFIKKVYIGSHNLWMCVMRNHLFHKILSDICKMIADAQNSKLPKATDTWIWWVIFCISTVHANGWAPLGKGTAGTVKTKSVWFPYQYGINFMHADNSMTTFTVIYWILSGINAYHLLKLLSIIFDISCAKILPNGWKTLCSKWWIGI